MEDVLCVEQSVTGQARFYTGPAFSYFAVFDGHGGDAAAHFAREHLLEEITSHPSFWSDDDELVLKAITDGFLSTHKLTWKALGWFLLHIRCWTTLSLMI